MTSETAELAGWMAGMSLAEVPDDVVARAKDCIIDSVGCIVAGTAARPCQVMLDVLSRSAGEGEVRVMGTGRRLPPLAAAYLNAQAANALDFDDSYRDGAPSHPGATIVPPAFAIGELRSSRGDELLRAVIVGYEASLRIGRAIQPTPQRKAEVCGYATWQVFGASAVAGSLLGLTAHQTSQALGLAAVHAPVASLRKLGTEDPQPFPWIKSAYGAASEAGVLAALLAAENYVGSRTIFDGPRGFWVMAGSDRYRPELMTQGLGSVWLIRDVGFKHYGCCRWTHTMLDALQTHLKTLSLADIEAVEVAGFDEFSRLKGDAPTSVVDAQFHAPYLAALELLRLSPAQGLSEADLTNPVVLALSRRVTIRHDPAADAAFYSQGSLPIRVTVTTFDGRRHVVEAQDPTGSTAAGGYSRDLLEAKFMRLASPRLGMRRAVQAVEAMHHIEQVPVATLAALLA